MLWPALLLALALVVAARLGAFSLFATIDGPAGPLRLPDAFASVDHPFHAARAETLRRSLAAGVPLRWIGDHQGGYPAEFYPLGVAWLDVGVWALLLGALPMAAVHKLVVILIFLLPGAAFVLLARRDRWPLGVAFVALAAHVAVPGGWWHGGYTELVQWGLVTNVAAATALLFVLAWLTDYLIAGGRLAAVGAAVAAAAVISTNPRGSLALVVIGVSAWLIAIFDRRERWRALLPVTGRLALVAAIAGLLAAPEIVALLRFSDLYVFVRYEHYANLQDFLVNAIQAVGLPVFLLGLLGLALAPLLPGRPATRVAALALLLYAGATLLFTLQPEAAALIPQLETTRLMPFQRFLTIYLAATATGAFVHQLATIHLPQGGRLDAARRWLPEILYGGLALTLLIGYVSRPGGPPPIPAVDEPRRGLYAVESTAALAQADLETAIKTADRAAVPGTAILVIGSALSWHQQLWAPLWTDRPLFYDDWLWYWHPDHAATPGYQFARGHNYPDPARALEPDYLSRHGIGAVVVTGEADAAAAASPLLRPVATGTYDVYLVERPTTIVTFDGDNAAATALAGGQLTAAAERPFREAVVRRNWFPRWRATVDGEAVPISRDADGYMRIAGRLGATSLTIDYVVDGWDWLARGLALFGFAVACGLGFRNVLDARRRGRGITADGERPVE